jgi:hypothetical protein
MSLKTSEPKLPLIEVSKPSPAAMEAKSVEKKQEEEKKDEKKPEEESHTAVMSVEKAPLEIV